MDTSDPTKLNIKDQSPRLEIRVLRMPGPDFTTYRNREFEKQLPQEELLNAEDAGNGRAKKLRTSYSGPLTIRTVKDESIPARAMACRAYRGKFWSVTLRTDEEHNRPPAHGDYDTYVKVKLTENKRSRKVRGFLGYCPEGYGKYPVLPKTKSASSPDRHGKSAIYLNDLYPLCRELYSILLDPKVTPHPSGLIVITGATDSSKSIVTRGLIFLFLEAAAEKARATRKRRPHLVTFEDPIEQYYIRDPALKGAQQMPADNAANLEKLLEAIYIDYTPREKGEDADNLKRVTKDALRQTPAVLFVGETREKDDWRDLIEFAGSGHLVVTTSHANSVVEAMSGIFRETDTKTPAQRSDIARRILGIVNIRSYTTTDNIRALLPSVWKRTDQSVSDLIADGLASILPAAETKNQERGIGYYGRSYLAGKLTASKHISKKVKQAKGVDLKEIRKAIKSKALEWDLKGV